jgi:predicted protein tyrosine phosphatase
MTWRATYVHTHTHTHTQGENLACHTHKHTNTHTHTKHTGRRPGMPHILKKKNTQGEDLACHIYSVVAVIDEVRRKGQKVLVHCTQGVSRYTDIRICRHTYIQTYVYADIRIYRHTSINILESKGANV